ncbi:ATP-binding cassette domain-containing protein [Campylobacter mucosalis]|uniref:Dipeptide/oligopeptide/nickel ABC transporter, ATP-binding protein n=1 Tax=Campylobacter mucosalis CCUG 21559 TaxID=1032067 RepID=A0A6G5QFK0_9BACT|nr:ATP-binding cassette domain-containing protein [Campylobacter mucosalis]QCD44394.1 dipeptide/oligopeptide/nickel ABC transporter, ATP-binding protein [Campylobacter mucosalis CCUG 21559]
MILELDKISHYYHASYLFKHTHEPVLDEINLDIKKGKCTALMGRSGSGKSTLAHIIMGLLKPSKGEIKFDGSPLLLDTLSQRRKFYSQAQLVFQDPISAVNPRFSTKEVLCEPLKHLFNLKKDEINARVEQICEVLYIKKSHLEQRALSLSGGELGRVCLARAMIVKPKLLILDESLSGFDLALSLDILNFLKTLKGKMSFIFITHDLRLARNFADEIVLLENGKIVEKTDCELKSEFGQKLQSAVL